MLSSDDLERLIAAKKREIEREKINLGLSPSCKSDDSSENKENVSSEVEYKKKVKFKEDRILSEHNAQDETEERDKTLYELEEHIPPDLERYIRRYVGLPVMLKAGEYSPNNPLVRGERVSGDVLLGLGEYERRRNTLRKIRQAQYREYLDQQAKKKQEAKEQAERERKEREEKERLREERERQLLLERDRYSPERRRASVSCVPVVSNCKVDTGVQVERVSRPLSVAVQTDDAELYRLPPSPVKCLTEAERELSPRTVGEPRWDNWEQRRRSYGDFDERTSSIKKTNRDKLVSDLRHSYMPSIFDADAIQMRNTQVEKEAAERRQSYQQELKNQILEQQRIREERKTREKLLEQAEMRRLEQQLRMLRMAQERETDRQHNLTAAMKTNAKEYEYKRTELQKEIDLEQEKLFRSTSQPLRNIPRRPTITSRSDTLRSKLPLYYPQERIFQPIERDKKPYSFNIPDSSIFSTNYDVDSYLRKNLNFKEKSLEYSDRVEKTNDTDVYNYANTVDTNFKQSTKETENIPSEDYKESFNRLKTAEDQTPSDFFKEYKNTADDNNFYFQDSAKTADSNIENIKEILNTDVHPSSYIRQSNAVDGNFKTADSNITENHSKNVIIEKALIHEPRKATEPSKSVQNFEKLPIPLLRHSPSKNAEISENNTNLSEAMKKVDDKWKVPAVQKNILKSLPSGDGKNISILTQLGSIRRQLQLEQLKLDKMLNKNDA